MKRLAIILLTAAAAAMAAPESFDTSAGKLEITLIQHASLMIQAGGKVLYIDPAQGAFEGRPKADYILITDIHGDHMAPPIVTQLSKPSTVVVGPKAVGETIKTVSAIAAGEKKTLGDFAVEAIAAYNLPKPSGEQVFHEKGRGLGYVVTYGGKRFYFSGDTEGTPEMKALKNIDVAFICMNLPYTMTPQAAAEAVRAFHPAVAYPYHYRGQDTRLFAQALAGSGIEVRLRDVYPAAAAAK